LNYQGSNVERTVESVSSFGRKRDFVVEGGVLVVERRLSLLICVHSPVWVTFDWSNGRRRGKTVEREKQTVERDFVISVHIRIIQNGRRRRIFLIRPSDSAKEFPVLKLF
jgi:hypothetical protein